MCGMKKTSQTNFKSQRAHLLFSPMRFKIGNNLDNLEKQLFRGARATRSRFFCSEEHLFFILRSEMGTGEFARAPEECCLNKLFPSSLFLFNSKLTWIST